ncbi:ash family protein [Escherichia coli]|nr:ash family protein [Escherichia coli]EEQ9280021.1 ash family protein [Escherichia coli]EEV8268394.1 ash family protein [Escherichia coli]EEZ1533780.1 ash family protein [Escherichia coli]EEZ2622531.1 ash family protein [Escherichia coli]
MMIPAYIKYLYSGLLTVVISRYSFSAVAKSAAGIGVPYNLLATIDAPCVFFTS